MYIEILLSSTKIIFMSYLVNILSYGHFEVMLYRYTYAYYENSYKLFYLLFVFMLK